MTLPELQLVKNIKINDSILLQFELNLVGC